MFAICIEASHQRGLGHLFRMINFSALLRERGFQFRFFLNADEAAQTVLERNNLQYETVVLEETHWQQAAITRYGISIWLDDRLNTSMQHAKSIASAGIPRVTFDDHGEGARLAALNIAALSFDNAGHIAGDRVLRGPRYLILNQDIARYRHLRSHQAKIVVSMGGSDTYGVTVKVVESLKVLGQKATIILGPGFSHVSALERILDDGFVVKRNVHSLMEEFSHYDLAITGGGVTPFEANAAGLPCVVIANEDFEVPVCKGIEAIGGARFAGHHSAFDLSCIAGALPIAKMSQLAMQRIDLEGADRVLDAIKELV